MLTFAHPWFLLLLPLPWLIRSFLPAHHERKVAVRVPFLQRLSRLAGLQPGSGVAVARRPVSQWLMLGLTWLFVVAALTRPQWLEEPIIKELPMRDLLVAVDLSGSMEAEDFTDNDGNKVDRLTAVKQVLDAFFARRDGDRVGLILFGVFTALFVLAAVLVDRWLYLPGLLPASARLPVSIPLIAIGVAITAWSATHFLRVRGTPVPFNPPPELVDSGPYRFARNPMVTGVFVLLFGIGFAIDSVSLVCFFTPLYVLAHAWELKKIEEPELERRLGAKYVEYRDRTPMFVPGFGRREEP